MKLIHAFNRADRFTPEKIENHTIKTKLFVEFLNLQHNLITSERKFCRISIQVETPFGN